jgi:putative ABC transport system permease protein
MFSLFRSFFDLIYGLFQRRKHERQLRDAIGVRWIADMKRHFCFSFRRIVKAPLLSMVVILSLGLGIGANTAIFSVIHRLLLRPLQVDRPEEIAFATAPGTTKPGVSTSMSGGRDYVFSYSAFRELEREQHASISELAGFRYVDGTIAYKNNARSGGILTVSGGYFPLLRVRPFMGRTLVSSDDKGAGNPVAMLGYEYWKDQLGSPVDVLNQPIRLYGRIFTIVGVTPEKFRGTTVGMQPDAFIPLASFMSIPEAPIGRLRNYGTHSWIYQIVRIKPGVTREQAAAYYTPIYSGIVEEIKSSSGVYSSSGPSAPDPGNSKKSGQAFIKFIDGSRGYSIIQEMARAPLVILLAATAFVLIIAMANAANLMLARSAARRRELAICAALGANRGKIMGQLLCEALSLAAAGGVAGIAFSCLILQFLTFLLGQLMLAAPVSQSLDVVPAQLEWPVLFYGIGLAMFTGGLFGLYPAIEAARVAPMRILDQESGRSSNALGSARVRKALVCAQVMLSAILLIPTGLFLKSLVNLMDVDLGLQTGNQVVFRLFPEMNGYSPEQSRALFERVERNLSSIPGVTSVTSAQVPPIGNSNNETILSVEGITDRQPHSSSWNEIGPGFFAQMGIPILLGREFTERDNLAGLKVAIVNEQFAKDFFAGQNPIGRKIGALSDKMVPDIEIVGVVKDSHYASVRQTPPKVFFLPWRQNQGTSMLGSMTFYLRSALPPAQVVAQVRKTMQSVDSSLPLEGLQTMEDQVKNNLAIDRLIFQLAGILAMLATVLAMTGLYGVMAYSVIRRTREIGIRLAIGANPTGIRQMVIREMLLILAIGLILGIPSALAVSKMVESSLFGVKSYDLFVVVGASLALGLAAFAAAYLPAWRASRVDPLNALRYE